MYSYNIETLNMQKSGIKREKDSAKTVGTLNVQIVH